MIDNEDYESINIHYIEVEWFEENNVLTCLEAHWRDLFRSTPESLYINWAAAMQVQFHVSLLNQSFTGTREQWAREYLRVFVNSAERRCKRMYETYVIPFKKYITEENSLFSE